MKLQFKHQQYQTDAVEAVVRVFAGQPFHKPSEYIRDLGKTFVGMQTTIHDEEDHLGFSNAPVEISENQLLSNIHAVQKDNHIMQSASLFNDLGECQLDVEMETGTGKTYVYTKTMFELNKRYGWSKFIIVVPSIAIREGVAKSLKITEDHFMEDYGKKLRTFVYSSDHLNDIDTYSQSNDIYAMIINQQAFNTAFKEDAKNKAARIIFDKRDEFQSRRPIDVLAANRPILILDEPQKLGGAKTKQGLQKFKPLFTLNYSATHKEHHNPVYVLDALDAYNHKLVKQIEVVGFELKNIMGADSYMYLTEIVLSKNEAPKARIEMEVSYASGRKRETRVLCIGDDMKIVSQGMEQYDGYKVSDIHVDALNDANSYVEFINGKQLHLQEAFGNLTAEHKARIQIRETIRAHFRKEERLFRMGIKCLSLFFLDEVANYRQYDADGNQILGKYGEIFEEEYHNVYNETMNLFNADYEAYLSSLGKISDAHAGYFSIDKKGHAINSDDKDITAFDLILKNKERLLSFEEPVRFIFSHSALREGWDNPNVFQICTLRQSNSTTTKRQEVGRGLRLCVNVHGVRQDAETLGENVFDTNRLTVIANESYADFAKSLQSEISEDLYERPKNVSNELFEGIILNATDADVRSITVSNEQAQIIMNTLSSRHYITTNGEVSEVFKKDLRENNLKLFEDELAPFSEDIYKRVQAVYDPSVQAAMVKNASRVTLPEPTLNDNFKKKEFVELWKRINHKYAYTVTFNTDELIEKVMPHLNAENGMLYVNVLRYEMKRGVQKESLSGAVLEHGNMMKGEQTATEQLNVAASHVRYDLLGAIAANTSLLRRTVATILSQLRPQKFAMYQQNPEEFIRKVSNIINEQKATMVVEHIKYNRIEGEYDSNIFTEEKHNSDNKAFRAQKSIVDYVYTDGTAEDSIERKFVEQLESSQDVVVYAKLPKGFKIPTPMGNYSPDWAIAFEEGSVKHVYFVAETKGKLSSLQLRDMEKGKISCAEHLYAQFASDGVNYKVVKTFDELLNIVK